MEIKRCPFCGGEGHIWIYDHDGWYVDCENCGARTEIWGTEDEAIERWNRRVEDERDK